MRFLWDAALGGEVAAAGVVVYEEQVLGQLVLDVGEESAPVRASGLRPTPWFPSRRMR